MAILTTAFYIALCIALFSLAIAIHEFGHFIVALKLGLNVERFSLGFGPAIWKRKWRGVEYRISWIPLGGYVSIPDVDPEGTDKLQGGSSGKKERIPAWKELLVAFAGPAMNVVLAVVLAIGLALVPNARFGQLPAVIGNLIPGESAEKAGLKVGDTVLKIGGRDIQNWSDLQTEVQISGTNATPFVVRRGEETITLSVSPRREKITGACFIGALSIEKEGGVSRWLPDRNPLRQIQSDAGAIFRVLHALVTPKEMRATGNALGGPVMIAEGIYSTIRHDFWDGIGFLRFLNVNLAVLNLLPIPVLDGGLIMFALIALVFRRRVPDKIVGLLSTGFMYLLIALMAFLIWRDSARSWRIHTYKPEAVSETENGDAAEKTDAQL
ncbi:MAG: site-2 protease family protein [Lentisphaerae bacterium]|jgi:regulator of sigma E protease|nr:site-2 protease family protein [Lentisphaerota bacterium]